MAGRAWLRLDTGLCARDGDPGAGRDRSAAAPQSGRDELVGAVAAQAGRPVDGHDARDHVAAPVRDQGSGSLRQPGQGSGGTAADIGRRWPVVHPVHDGPAGRHRGDASRACRDHPRNPALAQGIRARSGSDRAELPGQGPHCDGGGARRRIRGFPGDGGGHPIGDGAQDAHPGAAEPGVARRVPGVDRRGCGRLGRGVAADAGPREPGAAVARVG